MAPYVLGIGGGSGSGKSTIANRISAALAPRRVEIVNQDRFFKPPSEMPTYYSPFHGEQRPNFNHPESFDAATMLAGCRAEVEAGNDSEVVIIEGILVLHFAGLRRLLDLACYVTVELDEMLARRTERNVAAGYGGTREEIGWYNAECVTPYHRRFNAPTARFADVLIPNGDDHHVERDRAIAEVAEVAEVAEIVGS